MRRKSTSVEGKGGEGLLQDWGFTCSGRRLRSVHDGLISSVRCTAFFDLTVASSVIAACQFQEKPITVAPLK